MLSRKIIIIGCGHNGLTTAAYLLENNCTDFIMLEKMNSPGYHWRNVYDSLQLNTIGKIGFSQIKERFSANKEGVNQLFDFLISKYKLDEHISYNTSIKSIESTSSGSQLISESGDVYNCKYLVIATGLFSQRYIPTEYGDAIHSSETGRIVDSKNQKILIIGYRQSACDLALLLSKKDNEVTIFKRSDKTTYSFTKLVMIHVLPLLVSILLLPNLLIRYSIEFYKGNLDYAEMIKNVSVYFKYFPKFLINSFVSYFVIIQSYVSDYFAIFNTKVLDCEKIKITNKIEGNFDSIIAATGYKMNPMIKQFISSKSYNWELSSNMRDKLDYISSIHFNGRLKKNNSIYIPVSSLNMAFHPHLSRFTPSYWCAKELCEKK